MYVHHFRDSVIQDYSVIKKSQYITTPTMNYSYVISGLSKTNFTKKNSEYIF